MTTTTALEAISGRSHTPQPPPPEGSVTPGGFVMPVGYIAQAGVRRSRPGSIDPNAASVFAAWLARVEEPESEDGMPNIPGGNTGIIGYSALRNRAFPRLPSKLAAIGGDNQSAPVSTRVADPLLVAVLDSQNAPVSSAVVTFKVDSGGGSFGGSATELRLRTDVAGRAKVDSWVLGPIAGQNGVIVKFRRGKNQLLVKFQATGTKGPQTTSGPQTIVGPPSQGKITGGSRLVGIIGSPLLQEPEVTVLDTAGNPVPGVVVEFEILTGGGTLEGETSQQVTTDSTGVARSKPWTLGPVAGKQTLAANVAGMPQIVFTAKAVTAGRADAVTRQREPVAARFAAKGGKPDRSPTATRRS